MKLLHWLAGGDHQYIPSVEVMRRDWLWIGIYIAVHIVVLAGFWGIAAHWWANQRLLVPEEPAKKAQRRIAVIFALGGTCGFGFPILRLVWPAIRLDAVVMLAVAWFTWRYLVQCVGFLVVYVRPKTQAEYQIDNAALVAQRKLEAGISDRLAAMESELNTLRRNGSNNAPPTDAQQ